MSTEAERAAALSEITIGEIADLGECLRAVDADPMLAARDMHGDIIWGRLLRLAIERYLVERET